MLRLSSAALLRRTQRIRERSREFFERFPTRDGRFPFSRAERAAFLEQHREAYDALTTALKGLETEFAAITQKPEELTRLARRSFEIRQELSFLFESNERNFVYWYERRNKGVFLAATPIDVSQILRERLFETFDTVVLTSATLTVGGRFEYIRQRVGLDHTKERALPPEFDWARQALLYTPRSIPDVRNPGFGPAAADEIVNLLEFSQGRAFCLFTSYSQMKDLFERVRNRVDFPLLLQGTAPRSVLLERFKNTPGAVLFATSSFWQGVDVPGDQLSCVIVDRLPFAVPSDPIVAARVSALQEEGRNPFAEFQVPQAVLALKQGFGRLIRTKTDRGVLALLDSRIERMPYGKIFYGVAAAIRQDPRPAGCGEILEQIGPAVSRRQTAWYQGTSMFQVSVEETFSSGHALRGYRGKCENVHGHNYRVRVTIEGPQLDSIGLLVDFTLLKQVMREIIGRLDHQFINDLEPFRTVNPSAENLAKYFYDEMKRGLKDLPAGARITGATIWETDTSHAQYSPDT